MALPAQLRPERGRSVGEQTGRLHWDKVCDMFSWGYYPLGEDTLAGCPVAEWGAGPIAGQYARFMEVKGAAFGVSPRQIQRLVWECHSCSAPPFPRPGSQWRWFWKHPDSTILSPLWLPCLHTQPALCLCLTVANLLPHLDVGPT